MTAPHRPMSPRPLAILVLTAALVVGAVAGAALDRLLWRRHQPSILADSAFHPLSSALRSPTPEERRLVRAELSRALTLTAAQDSVVDAIMAQRAGEFSALREEIRPRVERLVSDVRHDVEQVLTPAQRERFRRLQQGPAADAQRMSSTP